MRSQGETKLFRDGDYPVLRGTALILDERNANLWTTGYVPELDTYIGPETPNPLFITMLRGKLMLTILDEAPSDEERQRSLEGCIDLLKHATH